MPTALCPGCSTSEPAPCIWPEKIAEDCAGPWTPGTPMGNLGQPSGIESVQLWLLQSFGQRVNGWKILAISFSLKISLSSECKWLFLKKKGLCLLAPLCLKKIKEKNKSSLQYPGLVQAKPTAGTRCPRRDPSTGGITCCHSVCILAWNWIRSGIKLHMSWGPNSLYSTCRPFEEA